MSEIKIVGTFNDYSSNHKVADVSQIKDSSDSDKSQKTINGELVTAIEGEISARESTDGRVESLESKVGNSSVSDQISSATGSLESTLRGVISDEVTRAQAAEDYLGSDIRALTQSNVVPVSGNDWEDYAAETPPYDSLDPQVNTIYRVSGDSEYYDYVWDAENSDMVLMATYDNAIMDGIVFDITFNNNNTAYSSLADALGANAVNIPANKRSPGMSIKFNLKTQIGVDENEDPVYRYEYVQYRYIKSDVTNASMKITGNWDRVALYDSIGIDEEKTVTNTGTYVTAQIYGNFKAGTRILCDAYNDGSFSYFVRIHYTDGTLLTLTSNASGTYSAHTVLEKDADYAEATRAALSSGTRTIKLRVRTQCQADIVVNKKESEEYTDSQVQLSESTAKSYVDSLVQQVSVYAPVWEFGSITFSNNGFAYVNSSSRVRTKQGTTIHLYKDDVIGLSNYTGKRYYIGWKKLDGTYAYNNGWLTSDFTVEEEGDYGILLSYDPEATVSDVSDLSDYFFVKSLRSKIKENEDEIGDEYRLTETKSSGTNSTFSLPCNIGANKNVSILVDISALMKYNIYVDYADGSNTTVSNQSRGNSFVNFVPAKNITQVRIVVTNNNESVTVSTAVKSGQKAVDERIIVDVDSQFNSDGFKRFPTEYFQIGDIGISTSGWSYANNDKRVRLSQGRTIHLKVGDVIGLSDYNDRKFYLGGRIGQTYITAGWNYADYTIQQEGDYVINCAYVNEHAVSAISDFADKVFVKRGNGTFLDYIEKQVLPIGNITSQLLNEHVYSVAHRGYTGSLTSPVRPENTIASFQYAKQLGYKYVETDVKITSDGKYVLLHDTTIDRTSNGTGSVSAMSLAELKTYSFGYLNGNPISGYTDQEIPTLSEFLTTCHRLGLIPLIEIEVALTDTQCNEIISIIKTAGMYRKCSIISLVSTGNLERFHSLDGNIDLGVLEVATSPAEITDAMITYALSLKGESNEVFIDAHTYTATEVQRCIAADIPLGIYTINNTNTALSLPDYVSFITTDSLDFGKILYQAGMSD